jgi:hypothetical protein
MTREPLAARRDLLAAMLDTLVPADGGFPSAAEVALDHVLAIAAASADLEVLLSSGVDATEAAARAHGVDRFVALGADAREPVLRRVEAAEPEFFDALVRHAYDGYYSHPAVLACLGVDPRPPQPHGHRVEPRNLPDLGHIRGRGQLYRPA